MHMSSSDQSQTQMTKPPVEQTKMVKVKVLYPIRVTRTYKGKEVEEVVTPGTDKAPRIVEVSEEEAKEFCDTKFDIGMKEHFGPLERRSARRTSVVRAERVK